MTRTLARRLYPWLLCLAAATVMYWRAPEFLAQPRIWAEEGTVYMAYAYSHTFWQALLAPHQGYYALFPNLATILALATGVPSAPAVTTWLSFGAQMLPIALVAWGNSEIWNAWYKRLLGVLVVLFAASSGEVWLNTINAQFYWSICAYLVLLENTRSMGRWRRWLYLAVLVMSGLTGAVTCFILPVFLFKALLERNRGATMQAGVLTAAALIQAWAWWSTRAAGLSLASRLGNLDLASLVAVVSNRTILAPALGQSLAQVTAERMTLLRAVSPAAFNWLMAASAVGFLTLLVALIWRTPRRNIIMASAYVLVVILTVVTALVAPRDDKFLLVYPRGALRYFYGPSVMFLLLVLANIEFRRPVKAWQTWMTAIILLAGVSTGIAHYRSDIDQFRGKNWPSWRWEIARWQANPQHEILIWPPPWKIKLQR